MKFVQTGDTSFRWSCEWQSPKKPNNHVSYVVILEKLRYV
jgi:hypothetical protein